MAKEQNNKKAENKGKDISLASIGKLLKGGKVKGLMDAGYPTKTTMNLYQSESGESNKQKKIVVGVVAAVLLLAFLKFGILDPLGQLSAKQEELASQQAQLSALQSSMKDLNEVSELYDGYMARYGSGSADCIAVLDMVEDHVMSKCTVTALSLGNNTLTLTLYNVPLDTVGTLAKDLEQQEMVSSVNVSTATTENSEGKNTTSTLIVSLVSTQSEEG